MEDVADKRQGASFDVEVPMSGDYIRRMINPLKYESEVVNEDALDPNDDDCHKITIMYKDKVDGVPFFPRIEFSRDRERTEVCKVMFRAFVDMLAHALSLTTDGLTDMQRAVIMEIWENAYETAIEDVRELYLDDLWKDL